MSKRVMADGKTYDRMTCLTPRRSHRPVPVIERGKMPHCETCNALIYFAQRPHFSEGIWKHYPGTFWENDMPRWRR